MSVDQTVEAAMEAQFWDIFSVGVGVMTMTLILYYDNDNNR